MNNFHFLTYAVILSTFFLVPFLVFSTYYFSKHGLKKSLTISIGVTLWAALMYIICRYLQSSLSEIQVAILLVVNLVWPSALIFWKRDYFIGEGLSLSWLTGLQVFRNIGALFLLENARGLVGTTFAYFAGIGDVIVGVTALCILFLIVKGKAVPRGTFYFLIAIGVIDFISAFSFGILSSPLPFQLFAFTEQHLVSMYPLGLIPFFLVPLSMSYHALMYVQLRRKNI